MLPMPYTEQLRYSRLERLHFKVFGRWPERVVQRRLCALEQDEQNYQRVFAATTPPTGGTE